MDRTFPSQRDIEQALDRDEFAFYYQPILAADGKTPVCAEALVRWKHPSRGLLPPSVFLPCAERGGLVPDIGRMALTQACRTAATWPQPIAVAVNISPLHFAQASLTAEVESALAASGLPASRLVVEIVESAAFDDQVGALAQMKRLHEIGVRLAMDDFGTGNSSLSLLQSLPFDEIKIDKSFVDGIPSTRSVAILQAMLALIRAMGMKAVAEGVETSEQHRFLKAFGCHYVQGYAFARPMAPNTFAEWLANPDIFTMPSNNESAAPQPSRP